MAKVNPLMSRSLTPPPGWTIDPEELNEEENWVAEDGLARNIADMYGFQQCTPIMCEVIGSGGGGVLFQGLRVQGKYICSIN
ncbi:hypothetical protein N7528_005769 [Penicillium herquei]|nr:hypothetical protein N7528_005769 [Penicillium herquei]